MKISKKTMTVTAAAAVVALLLLGGWQWHKKPSFCGTACHTAMGSYVASWQSGDNLAHAHAKAGLACLDCHESKFTQQVSELAKYVSGNYSIPLAETNIGTKEFCLQCHGSYEELAEKTEGYAPPDYNPHDSHYKELDCYTCHSSHGQSEFYCTSCHDGLKVPEGWKAVPM